MKPISSIFILFLFACKHQNDGQEFNKTKLNKEPKTYDVKYESDPNKRNLVDTTQLKPIIRASKTVRVKHFKK